MLPLCYVASSPPPFSAYTCKVKRKIVPHSSFSLSLMYLYASFRYYHQCLRPMFTSWADPSVTLSSISALSQLTCLNKLCVWDSSFIHQGESVSTSKSRYLEFLQSRLPYLEIQKKIIQAPGLRQEIFLEGIWIFFERSLQVGGGRWEPWSNFSHIFTATNKYPSEG